MKKSKIKLKDIILRIDHNDVLKEITRMGSCNPVNSCHHCRDWTQLIYKKQLIGKQQQHQSKENSNYATTGKYSIAIDSKDTFNRDVNQEDENEEKEKLKIKAITTTLNVKREAAKVLEPILHNYKSKTTTAIATPPTYNHNTELLKQCITACEEWMVTPNQFTFLPPLFRQVDFEEEIIDEHFDHITDDIQLQQLKILKAIICDRQGIGLTIDQITLLKGVRKSHLKRVENDPTCCCDIKHDSPSNLQIEIDIINEKMDQAVKEHLALLNDRLTTCWKPLNDFIVKILNMEKKLNDIVNDGLTERMDNLISQYHIVSFQDFWTPLVPEFKKKKSGVDVKVVDETFLGYLDQLTLAITDFYTSFVTTILEELIQFSKEFSVFVLSAIENLMERVTNNTMIVNHLQENGTKFDISKIKESCNIQNQTILKTADSIKDMVGTKLKEHLTDVTELRRIYTEESQPNVAARIEKVAHKDFRKKFKKVEHQYQTIRQHFRYELHKVLLENDWFNDLAIASIQSLMKEGEACESCVIQEAVAKFEIKNMELIEAKEELMDMFEHGITTGQHELDTVIGILFIAEAYRLKYDTDAMRKQALFLDSIGATSTNDDATGSSKKKKKKAKTANAATTIVTTTTNDDTSEEVKEGKETKGVEEIKETKQAQPAITSSTSNTVINTSTTKSKKVSPDKVEKQSSLDKKSSSKKNDQATSTITATTKSNSNKPESTITNKSTIKKNTNASTKNNNSNPSFPSPNNDDTKKNNAEIVSPVTKVANEKSDIDIINIPTSNQANVSFSGKVGESSNGWNETQILPTTNNTKPVLNKSNVNDSTTTKEVRFSKKKENQAEKLNQSQSTEKSDTVRFSNRNKKLTQDTSKPASTSSLNDSKTNKNNSWGQEQSQTTESTESSTTTTPTTKTQTKKKPNQRSSEWATDINSTDLDGWDSISADQTNNNEASGWGSPPPTNQTNDNVNSGWDTENEHSSDGWQFVGKNTSKKATTTTTTTSGWNTPISSNESKKPPSHQAQSTSKQATSDLNGRSKPTNKESKKEVSSGRDMPKNIDSVTSNKRNTTKNTGPTTSSGWGAPKKMKSTPSTSSGWGVVNNIESKKTASSGWETPKKVESTVPNCWDSPKKAESTISSCWDTPINVKTTTSGWDIPKKMESITSNGWDPVNNDNEPKKTSSPSSSGWSLPNMNEPEKNISSGWNPPIMKESESSTFNNNNSNNNNRMNYLSGWDPLVQSKSELPSYNNNINNNNVNIPMNEPAIVNVSISDLLKSAEQDDYQGSPFLTPIEQKNTSPSPPSSSSSIKPPPMSYPQFLSLPMGNPSTSIDQLHGMSTDSLILMIQSLRFENEQLKQSMSTLQQTVSMTLALAKDREEQTIQLFNSRKQADLEKARIYVLSLEAKIQDLESQIRMQSANNNNMNSSNHQPHIARTGFDNQDIFADYREEMRVGSGRNTTNDRYRQYNQRSNTTGNSGKKLWSRTTIVKCSNCGESGHASSDCQDSCRYCDSREHLSEQCPQPF